MDASRWSIMNDGNIINQVKDLLNKNESLTNEVHRKEVIINSIEYKMFEVSNNIVKAGDFGEWIDDILRQKMFAEAKSADNMKQVRSIVDRKFSTEKQWTKMCEILGKYIGNAKTCDDEYLETVDQWMAQRRSKEVKLEIENGEYKNILSSMEDTIRKFSEVCSILRKHMKNKKQSYDENCTLQHVDEWLTQREKKETKLERENEEYKKIIAKVESGISRLDLKIESFADCLNSCDISLHDKSSNVPDSSTKTMLELIQKQIRNFDEEDAEFQVKDFSSWIEKLKSKMNDLESNAVKEKKMRSSKEKQHAMEREILNYLFNQKQSEISMLKEKVCNKYMSLSKTVPGSRLEG